MATNFFCTAYSLLTAIFVKKLIGKRWLHTVDQVRYVRQEGKNYLSKLVDHTSMLVHASVFVYPHRSRLTDGIVVVCFVACSWR